MDKLLKSFYGYYFLYANVCIILLYRNVEIIKQFVLGRRIAIFVTI